MTVLSLALKGALVLSLAGAAAYLLRSAPAAARHAVWVAAFVALLAMPLLAAYGPSLELPVLPSAFAQSAAPVVPAAPLAPTPPEPLKAPPAPPAPLPLAPLPIAPIWGPVMIDAPPAPLPAPPAPPAAPAPPLAPLAAPVEPALAPAAPRRSLVPPVLARLGRIGPSGGWVSLWAGGALLVLLGWMIPLVAAWHLVSRTRPERSSTWLDALEHARLLSAVEGPVRLLRSDRLDVPVAWGWGSPTIVLPANADDWADDRREAVLLHELAHLARGDAQTQLIAQVAVALHWFNPLAWWAYGRMLEEREHACDDAVLRGGARPSAYAGHLVEIARGLRRRPTALTAFAPMARSSRLEGRVLSILGDHQRAALSRLRVAGFIAFALVLALPLGACQLTSRTAEAMPAPDPPAAPAPAPRAAPAPRPAPDVAAMTEDMEHELADARASLAHLEHDMEASLAPAMEAARQHLDAMRARYAGHPDVDWAEIEDEMEAAFAEVEFEFGGALSDAMKALEEVDWPDEARMGLREAQAERERALAEIRRELGEAEREVEQAVRESAQDRARAQSERQREADQERNRAREERQRELDRERNRQRDERREADRDRRPVISGSGGTRPSAPPSSYSYSISTNGQTARVVAGNGPGAWAASLEGWSTGVRALASQIEHAETEHQRESLAHSLAQMAHGLEGIESASRGWADSASEARSVARSVAEARSALAAAERGLNKSAACND